MFRTIAEAKAEGLDPVKLIETLPPPVVAPQCYMLLCPGVYGFHMVF